MEKVYFLKKYNLKQDDLSTIDISWEQLMEIHDDFITRVADLTTNAQYFVNKLLSSPKVHSVRFRIKDPEHLIEKIIRKCLEDSARVINIGNYIDEIDDLIGLRILHLFKDDWSSIHAFVSDSWDFNEDPIAYVREGDSSDYKKEFTTKGCKVKTHERGYRSVHYVIKSNPSKQEVKAELQVRTLFEEGWSEIDHILSYPYKLNDELITGASGLLNRLSGLSDELGSYSLHLNEQWNDQLSQIQQKDKLIAKLKKQIEGLEIDKTKEDNIFKTIERLNSNVLEIQKPLQRGLRTYNFKILNMGNGINIVAPKPTPEEKLSEE